MTPEEIRLRSIYLFLTCSQAIEQLAARLVAQLPASADASGTLLRDQSVRRELGLLFRYWTTRQIWERLEASEADAKALNLALLRLFTNAFRLPRDGSGIRYAELSSLTEEIRELSQRLGGAVGSAPLLLATELRVEVGPWREAIVKSTREALELPLDQVAERVKHRVLA